jgi:hypothetical protein
MCKIDLHNLLLFLQDQIQLPEKLLLLMLLLHQGKHDARVRGMGNFKINMTFLLFLDEKFAATCISHDRTELLYTRIVYSLRR